MQAYGNVLMRLLSPNSFFRFTPAAGLKSFQPPPSFDDVETPDYVRLRVYRKTPTYPNNVKTFTMQKKLRLMRGPERIHNTLLHKQFGVMATGGGRLKYNNFEMIRMTVLRNIDYKVAFALFRVPEPWQPITKKTAGVRMGAGKGSIDHYVTPVKAGQIIFEIGGKIEYFEVSYLLKNIASRLPFSAIPVTQETLEKMKADKEKLQKDNLNPYTWKYIIQNNMLGCHRWISKYDRRWFCEYL